MTDDPRIETLARELHAIRAEPDPAFARELDRRAAEWARERPRRLPPLRIAVPAFAVAAAATVAVVASTGGDEEDQLAVRVVSEQAGAEALGAEPRRDAAAPAEGISFVRMGEPVVVEYSITEPGRAEVELGGRRTEVEIPPGRGRLEISTADLSPGTYDLDVVIPTFEHRTRVEILPRR